MNTLPEDPKERELRMRPPIELNPIFMQKLLPVLSKSSHNVNNASKENVRMQIETLRLCLEKDVCIAGGVLDMDTGRVEFFT